MRPDDLHHAVLGWFADHARALPWREPGTDAWAVLVSEVMAQQTPVARVAPTWRTWMERWPTPAALAAASPAEVLRAWGRLGYPRRALRLHRCAVEITERHAGLVPAEEPELRALPGIGAYTAAAVSAFAYGRRTVVLDTNVRRVLARVLEGAALPAPALTRAETARAAELLPQDAATSARWNVAVMELGALVCTSRAPACEACPIAAGCRWAAAGRPADVHLPRRRSQSWAGSDRQMRGRIMAALRALPDGARLTRAELLQPLSGAAGADADQPGRALTSLVRDGLVAESPAAGERAYALPGRSPSLPRGADRADARGGSS